MKNKVLERLAEASKGMTVMSHGERDASERGVHAMLESVQRASRHAESRHGHTGPAI